LAGFWVKNIGLPISGFELWISGFLGALFSHPHSPIYNLQLRWHARPIKWMEGVS